jgi:hypothetical protein
MRQMEVLVVGDGVGCPLRDLAVPSLSEVDGDCPVRHHEPARAEHADGVARPESSVILMGTA